MTASQHSDVLPHAGEEHPPHLTLPPLAPTRHRDDGWTPERQRGFLEALASSGSVSAAARSVGMSRETAYELRRRADARGFAQAWDAARVLAGEHLLDLAWDRAAMGELRQIYYRGELVGETRHYDNRLLLGLIAQNRAALAQGAAGAAVASPAIVAAVASDWEAALDRAERGEALAEPVPAGATAPPEDDSAEEIAPPLPPQIDADGSVMSEAQALDVGLYRYWWDAALQCWLTNWPAPPAPEDWDGTEYRYDDEGEAQLFDPDAPQSACDMDDKVPLIERYARTLTEVEEDGLEREADAAEIAREERLELYRRAAFGLTSAAEQASLLAASGAYLARGGAG